MRILPLSDLHIEFNPYRPKVPDGVDLVILLGDIDKGAQGVRAVNDLFDCPVLYVAGNHEFYKGHLTNTLIKMKRAAELTNGKVRVLDRSVVYIGNVRILGCTGWTDYTSTGNQPLAVWDAEQTMSDFKLIRVGSNYRLIKAKDLIDRSTQDRIWLETELLKPFDGRTVVATHHAPSTQSILRMDYNGSHLSAAYANRWEHLLDYADLWLHGHTHQAVDYKLYDRARVVSNPLGYPGEPTGFNPNLIIEV